MLLRLQEIWPPETTPVEGNKDALDSLFQTTDDADMQDVMVSTHIAMTSPAVFTPVKGDHARSGVHCLICLPSLLRRFRGIARAHACRHGMTDSTHYGVCVQRERETVHVCQVGGEAVGLKRVQVSIPARHDLSGLTFVIRSADSTAWWRDGEPTQGNAFFYNLDRTQHQS